MKNRTYLTIAAASLGLVACGNEDAPTAAKATATPSAVYGVYSREVTEADFERTMQARNDAPGFEPSPIGRYQLTLAPGKGVDVFKVSAPEGGLTIAMDAKVDDGELRLVAYSAPEQGAFCDQAITAQAQYALTAHGSAIELTPTSDECADRDSVLTGTWKKG
jgi:hypothetical protein